MLKPGDVVGPYEIQGFIGQGGMGQVYRAFDPRLERTIALKIIIIPESERERAGSSPALSSESSQPRLIGEFSARLLREARAVAALSHPNVVAIYDVGESDGRLYLAMEYVVGSSLRSLVGNAELPLSRRVRWLVDVSRALEAAHRTGIIHRDIKPENVMVREDGFIKVLDFGIARRAVSRGAEDQQAIDTVTGGGAITGTPFYMAPEQIKGGDVDARCDQFAWAVMAYELVTGERPWGEAGDVLSLVAKVLTDPPRPIRTLVKDVPPVLDETIMRALAKDPAARFPSMTAVSEAIEPFASVATGGDRVQITPRARSDDAAAYAATTRVPTTVSVHPSPSAAETSPRTPSSKRRALSLAAPLILLGALGAAVYIVRTRPDTTTTLPHPGPSAARPLSTVPQAETAYHEAITLWHDGAGAKGRSALSQAIELDPTFAAAHLQLALEQASQGDPIAAQESFQSAYEHRYLLTKRDSFLLEASEPFVRAKPDVEEWETRLTAMVFRYPRDPVLQFYLGRARQRQGDNEGAKAAFEAAIRLDAAFVPALAALATTEKDLGSIADALATTDRCIKRSPVAATCVQTRYELLLAAGECKRAREEAAQWGALEPQSPRPFAALARALHADGAPRPSVEEVLSRRWSLLPAADRKQSELWDRASLAILDGDFARAEDLAREFDAGLPLTADSYDHAVPNRLRVHLLIEIDRMKDAAKAAHAFLDRMPAWPSYPFAPDPSIAFYEPIYRAGEMTKRELTSKRTEWLEHEARRASEARTPRDPWVIWATAYGGFAESREEAADALANAPRGNRPTPGRRGLPLDFALGKVYALIARWDEARPYLQQVVESCSTFDDIMVIAKARVLLAQAQEAKGDVAAAKASYAKVVETWPKGTSSHTLKRASERLATLHE
jgi:serine/threonine-protein kinase